MGIMSEDFESFHLFTYLVLSFSLCPMFHDAIIVGRHAQGM